MTTAYPLPVLPAALQKETLSQAEARGTALVIGTVVDMAGVAHAKAVPISRAASFHHSGIGAAPSWNLFCVDNDIALTADVGVAGDMRLRLDLSALTVLDADVAWAPAELFDQFGQPLEGCARGQLRKMQADAETQSIAVLVGTEVEFALFDDGSTTSGWQGYGARAFLEHRDFLVDLERTFRAAELNPEQIHAEYGVAQFEVTFPPTDPLAAADNCVLARLVIGEVARRHGMRVSFSPLPAPEYAGNGAHLHMSFEWNGRPLLSGGSGPHGLTEDGAAAMAGIVTGLPDLLTVFAGSILSTHRLQPGRWAGAHACWGLENREAAVRLCAATPANPYGANIELKCVDTSANPYLSVLAMLGLALAGIRSKTPLPDEVAGDPAHLPAGTVPTLSATHTEHLDRLQASQLARTILGNRIVESTLAVRRHEYDKLGDLTLQQLCERLRYCWSS